MQSIIDGPDKHKAKVIAKRITKDGTVKVFFRYVVKNRRLFNGNICMAMVSPECYLYPRAQKLSAGDIIWATPQKKRNSQILEGCFNVFTVEPL